MNNKYKIKAIIISIIGIIMGCICCYFYFGNYNEILIGNLGLDKNKSLLEISMILLFLLGPVYVLLTPTDKDK